jgi:hypothetical protein
VGPPTVSGFSLTPTATGAEPKVTLAWTKPSPAVTTGAPSAITSSSATVSGTVDPNGSQITDCHFVISAAASLPCVQQIGGGSAPVAVSAPVSGLSPATTYSVTLVAASAQGSGSGAPVTFTTASSQAPGSATGASAGQTLSLGALSLSPSRFRHGKRAPAVLARKLPSATTIAFTASEAATATLSFERAQPGIRAGKRCIAPARGHTRGTRCTRYTRVSGAVTLAAHAGTNKLGFDGVLAGGRALAPGRYRVSLRASAGAATASAAQRPAFTML